MKFIISYFYSIQNVLFQLYSKTNNWIKFKIYYLNEIRKIIYKTALFYAIEKENIDIIKYLLSSDKLDINFSCI